MTFDRREYEFGNNNFEALSINEIDNVTALSLSSAQVDPKSHAPQPFHVNGTKHIATMKFLGNNPPWLLFLHFHSHPSPCPRSCNKNQ